MFQKIIVFVQEKLKEPELEEPEPEEPEPQEPKIIEEPVGLESKETVQTSDLETALSTKDPWMQRKEDNSNQ